MICQFDLLAGSARLPERVVSALFPASIGLKVRRAVYEKDAEIELGSANRDLRMLVAAGLLVAHGETRARYYLATPKLRQAVLRDRQRIRDPYGTGNEFDLRAS